MKVFITGGAGQVGARIELADGRVEPPDTYFSRVFGRIGEMERLAHHISMLPSDASNRAAVRLRSGLAAAGAAA